MAGHPPHKCPGLCPGRSPELRNLRSHKVIALDICNHDLSKSTESEPNDSLRGSQVSSRLFFLLNLEICCSFSRSFPVRVLL